MGDRFSPTKPEAESSVPGCRRPSPTFSLVLLAVSCTLLFSMSCSTNNRPPAVAYPAHQNRETGSDKNNRELVPGDPQPGLVSTVQPSQKPETSENTIEGAESSRTISERRQPGDPRTQDSPGSHVDSRPKGDRHSEMDFHAEGRKSKEQGQNRHRNNDKRAPEHGQHNEQKEHRTETEADLPELRLIYSYSNPAHNLEASVLFQSGGEIGCASRQITKQFARREVTETKNQCFKKSIWNKVEERVKNAGLFSSKSKYRCKNPGERRATITLSVLEKTRSITIGPICEDEKDDLPNSLKKLLTLIQKLTLTLR